MMYDSLLARSFSKHEQQKLGYGALMACFLLALSLCTVFKPYLGPLPVLDLRLSMESNEKLQIVNVTISSSEMIIAKDAEILMKNTSLENDTTTTSHQIFSEIIIMKDTAKVNDTSTSSQNKTAEVLLNNPPIFNDTNSSDQKAWNADTITKNKMELICNTNGRSDFCEIKGNIRIDPISATVFIILSEMDILRAESANTSWSIRPYARKGDKTALSFVREWSVKPVIDSQIIPHCTKYHHDVPAILFSVGGYAGNHFHAFTDIIIPLFATARPFNGQVQFLITNTRTYWINKFETLLKALSRYQIIDIDKGEDIHCFTSTIVGLKGRYSNNKELDIDPSQSAYSMKHFRQFLRSSYSLKKTTAIKITDGENKKIKKKKVRKPRLLIISRKRSRSFTNVGEIVKMAENLGFKVVVAEPDANVSRFAEIMNSCDVVMGVHGAGLTNIVFLPENAVLIQVVPFGGADWVSRAYFEEPSKGMNIRYLEYKIRVEESSLIQQYPADHVVLRDPTVIQKKGWLAFKSVYLDKQNVKLDLIRFRPTLLKALELLHQ